MFCGLALYLAREASSDIILHNAALESFIIHARIMLDFLYPSDTAAQSEKHDDIIADDYFDDPSGWRAARAEKSALLCQAHRRAHKEVAHLTYTRVGITDDEKRWNFIEIAREVTEAFNRFLDLVPSGRLCSIQRLVIRIEPA
jgi:hypothetical protein